jgi:hypothetical protein
MPATIQPAKPTKYSWARIRKLHELGHPNREIAKRLGCDATTVRRVLSDKAIVRYRRHQQQNPRSNYIGNTCADCGKPITGQEHHTHRCQDCFGASCRTTIRDDELRCRRCGEWKPDDGFPMNRYETSRRGRHRACRPCNTITRRETRARTGR